jgi:hypothetical protein
MIRRTVTVLRTYVWESDEELDATTKVAVTKLTSSDFVEWLEREGHGPSHEEALSDNTVTS